MHQHARFPALLAFVAGGLSVALLTLVAPPPADPNQLYEFASTHRTAYTLYASLVLTWSVCSVPFVVVIADHLGKTYRSLVPAAQILMAGGILMLGCATFISVGAILAIISAAPAPSMEIAAYQLRFWSHLGFYLTDPGLMAWGLGQALLGWLSWHSRSVPGWISIIGLLGGTAGLLTLIVYQSSVLALVQLVCFAVWSIAIGIYLLKPRTTSSVV